MLIEGKILLLFTRKMSATPVSPTLRCAGTRIPQFNFLKFINDRMPLKIKLLSSKDKVKKRMLLVVLYAATPRQRETITRHQPVRVILVRNIEAGKICLKKSGMTRVSRCRPVIKKSGSVQLFQFLNSASGWDIVQKSVTNFRPARMSHPEFLPAMFQSLSVLREDCTPLC